MTIEDWTGRADADSYADSGWADGYQEKRGRSEWAEATTLEKESALVRACDYLERGYGRLWPGEKVSIEQRLSFPRCGLDETCAPVPLWLKEAQCEGAWIELLEPGSLTGDGAEGHHLAREREGEVEREFRPGAMGIRSWPEIHGILALHILNPSNIKVLRA
jgi:hypothetical protein